VCKGGGGTKGGQQSTVESNRSARKIVTPNKPVIKDEKDPIVREGTPKVRQESSKYEKERANKGGKKRSALEMVGGSEITFKKKKKKKTAKPREDQRRHQWGGENPQTRTL